MTDIRKYGETALDEARKPWLAAVGATDLAYDRLRKQLEELPAELRRVREGATGLDVRAAANTAAGQAREVYATTVSTARETYETLAHRGDLVVRRLRRRPEVREGFEKAEQVLADAEKTVAQAEEKVTRPARKPAPRKTTPRKTAAK
jgi:hypothetical protein